MPSVAYMNQSAPFWDFIASLEQQGFQRPQPENEHEHRGPHGPHDPQDPFAPWNWGRAFFGGGRGMPHRGGPPHAHDEHDEHHHEEPAGEKQAEMNDAEDNGEGPSGTSGSENEARAEGGGTVPIRAAAFIPAGARSCA